MADKAKHIDLRLDDMGFGGLWILQDPEEFCYGLDAVLLAAYAAGDMSSAKRICELGTGNGAVALILSRKTQVEEILAVEIQPQAAELACRNAADNDVGCIRVLQSDILDLPEAYNGRFDAVVTNPP